MSYEVFVVFLCLGIEFVQIEAITCPGHPGCPDYYYPPERSEYTCHCGIRLPEGYEKESKKFTSRNFKENYDPDELKKFSPRIFNGMEASRGQFPWMIYIIHVDHFFEKFSQHCAGTLFTRRHILSAAQCFHDFWKT